MRVEVKIFGRCYVGEMLYRYDYPHAVEDESDDMFGRKKSGHVGRFEQRPQRVGIRCDDGVIRHVCSQHLKVREVET